jgi:single-strand selective monofunctional uracil DNA glycosylase
VFIESSGRNRTPDKLPVSEREPLFSSCDAYLRRLVEILEAEWVIGIGAFAERRAREALADREVRIGRILHPSPANPRAHKDWSGSARRELEALGLCARRGAA